MNDEVIYNNMNLAMKVLGKMGISNAELRDRMIQAARIGIWKACKGYNKNSESISYIWQAIKWEISKEFRFLNKFPKDPIPSSLVHSEKERLYEYIPDRLSENEHMILDLELRGYTFKHISSLLDVDVKTFKNIRQKLLRKIKNSYE